MSMGYQPEVDYYLEFDQDGITTFKESIRILRWAVEIERVDILADIYLLSSYQESPREGHLEQIYHVLAFLKKKNKLTLYFDPRETLIDPSWFQGDSFENFKDQYQDYEEQLPPSPMCP